MLAAPGRAARAAAYWAGLVVAGAGGAKQRQRVTQTSAGGALSQTTNCPVSSHGLVVGTVPAAGQQEPFGLAVGLTVCATSATVTVPNVLSFDDTSARNASTAAGLTVGAISPDNGCLAEAGTVLTQNPNGGTQAQPGSAVTLTESSGRNSRGKPCVID